MSAALAQVNAQIEKLHDTTQSLKNQRDDARAALLDIISGCDMMLEPVMKPSPHMQRFCEEVKRVAKGGLT